MNKSSHQIKSEPDGDTADFYFFPLWFSRFFFSNQFPLPPVLQVSPSISPFPQIQTPLCLPSAKGRSSRDIDQAWHNRLLFDNAC